MSVPGSACRRSASRRCSSQAASTPPTAPPRCACQLTPGVPGSTPHRTPAVGEQDDDGQRDLARPARPEAAREQVREPAEDQPAGAEDDRPGWREQPGRQARRHHADQRGDDPAGHAAEQDEQAEREERQRVAGQVRPAGVQQGSREDLWQPVDLLGVDPVAVERVPAELVQSLQDPEAGKQDGHHHHGVQGADRLAPHGLLRRVGASRVPGPRKSGPRRTRPCAPLVHRVDVRTVAPSTGEHTGRHARRGSMTVQA